MVSAAAVKRSEEGEDTVVRLYNPLPQPVVATLTVSTAALYSADLAEIPGERLPLNQGRVTVTVPGKKMVTYRLK